MDEKDTPRIFVNTPMDEELVTKLDIMADAKESTRAQLIRLFVRQGWDEFSHLNKIDAAMRKQAKRLREKVR